MTFVPYTRDEVKAINEQSEVRLNEVEANVYKAMAEFNVDLPESIVTAQMLMNVTGYTEGQVRQAIGVLERQGFVGPA